MTTGNLTWKDGWWTDAEDNRISFDPRVTQLNGKDYVPLSPPDPRFPDQGTPQSYLKFPVYADVLNKYPDAFRQDANGNWYLSTDAQGYMSDVSGVRDDNTKGFWNGPGPMLLAASMFAAPVIAAGGAGAGGLGAADAVGGAVGADAVGGIGADTLGGVGQSTSDLFAQAYGDLTAGMSPSDLTSFNQYLGNTLAPGQSSMLQNLAPNFPGAQTALNGATTGLSATDALLTGGTTGAGATGLGTGAANTANYSTLNTLLSRLGAGNTPVSSIAKLLSGDAGADDYAKLLGALGSAGLGYLGANQQTNALNGVADKYLALGAPYRARLSSSYEPGFDLMKEPGFQSALDVSTKSVLGGLAAKSGNPYEQPGAVQQAQNYIMGNVALPQLNTYRSQLGSFGQLGTNTAGTANLGAAQASGGGLDSLGYGLAQATGGGNDLASILKKYGLGNNNFSLSNMTGF